MEGIVNAFGDMKALYWCFTLYTLAVGAAMTFVGRRHFKTLLMLIGLPIGYLIGFMISGKQMWGWIGGIISAVLFVICYPIFVFIIGMTPVAMLCLAFGIQSPNIFISLIALACGVAAIIYRKHIVIPVSAVSGACMSVVGLTLVFGGMNGTVSLILFLLLAAGGTFVQYKWTAKDVKKVTVEVKTNEEKDK